MIAPYSPAYDLVARDTGQLECLVTGMVPTATKTDTTYQWDEVAQKFRIFGAGYFNTLPWGNIQNGGKGFALHPEPEATNDVINSKPSAFTTGLADDWTKSLAAGLANTVEAADGAFGTGLGQRVHGTSVLDNGSVTFVQKSADATFAAGETATGSAIIKAPTLDVDSYYDVYLLAYNAADEYIAAASTTTIASPHADFRRFEVNYASLPANTDHVGLAIRVGNVDDTDSYDVTWCCVQLEKSSYASSYIPTTVAAVTRTASSMLANDGATDFAGLSKVEGTVAIVVNDISPPANARYFDWAYNSTNRIVVYKATSGVVYIYTNDGGTVHFRNSDATDYGACVIVGRWKNGEFHRLWVNGTEMTQKTGVEYATLAQTLGTGGLLNDYGGVGQVVGHGARITAWATALTEAQILTLNSKLLAGYSDPRTLRKIAAGII